MTEKPINEVIMKNQDKIIKQFMSSVNMEKMLEGHKKYIEYCEMYNTNADLPNN